MSKEIQELLKKKSDKEKKEFYSKLAEIFREAFTDFSVENNIDTSNIEELLKGIKVPEKFNIANVDEIAKKIAENIHIPGQKEFPMEMKVSNIKDVAEHIKIPKVPKFPSTMEISNFSDMKDLKVLFPENLKKLSFNKSEGFLKGIVDFLSTFAKATKNGIFISNKKPSEAIPVRMVDKKGVDFIEGFKSTVFGGVGGGGLKPAEVEYLKEIASGVNNLKLDVDTININTDELEDKLDMLIGFDINSDINSTIVSTASGLLKTITETDGIKTLTTVIDKRDSNNILITSEWS